MSNIHVIDGNAKPDQLAEILRKAESEWPAMSKILAFEARRKKAVFDSLVEAGFTVDQALRLTV